MCVYIYVYIHACPTRTPSHTRIKRPPDSHHARNRNEICRDMRVYTQDTLYVTIQPQYV